MNAVYGVKEDSRSFWRVRFTATALTIGLAGFVILSLTLVLSGPRIGLWIAQSVGLGEVFTWAWNLFQWPVVIALMLFVLGTIYYICPDIDQDWRWASPGAVFAVVMWLIVSLGFKAYFDHFENFNKVYGSITGIIVLMLWLYWSGMLLLVGGEINAEIERAALERQGASSVGSM